MLRSARVDTSVDQLASVETGSRVGVDVAHAVGANAATDDTEIAETLQHVDGAISGDAPELQVAARGQLQHGVCVLLRQLSDPTQLVGLNTAARETQTTHKGVFRRRRIK